MLQYRCGFFAQMGVQHLLKMAEGCGCWLSAEGRRECFVRCESQAPACGGFISLTGQLDFCRF